ncbi:hypothetical protein C3L33_02248, partial [Rhododendron williamsianum]
MEYFLIFGLEEDKTLRTTTIGGWLCSPDLHNSINLYVLGEEDEGGERGSGLGGYDHVGRTWERCSYGGGGRYALDIAPFKISPKCLFPGHMERDCKGVPCFRCRGFGHTAWDCKGTPYCGGGGWNFSSSGSWVGQPPIQESFLDTTNNWEDALNFLWTEILAPKVFHDQNIGHGNLLGGAFVVGSDLLPQHVVLLHEVTGGGLLVSGVGDFDIWLWNAKVYLILVEVGEILAVAVGIAAVEYILGTLVHSFDWRLPDGVELDMSEAFGLVLQKALLLSAVVVPRILTMFSVKPLSSQVATQPSGWPVVGCLLLLGTMPHVVLAQMVKTYGSVMYLKMGSCDMVVTSSQGRLERSSRLRTTISLTALLVPVQPTLPRTGTLRIDTSAGRLSGASRDDQEP